MSRHRPTQATAAALSQSARLRRMTAAHRVWAACLTPALQVALGRGADAAVGELALRRIDAARWSESEAWPQLALSLGGTAVALRLCPHPQWQELSEPAFTALDAELRLAIAAHLTASLRQALGVGLHAAGALEAPTALALVDTQPEATPPLLLLHAQLQAPGHSACVAWLGLASDIDAPAGHVPPATAAATGTGPDALLPLQVVLAQAQIGSKALRKLQAGSVVLLDALRPAWLMAGAQRVAVLAPEPAGLAPRLLHWLGLADSGPTQSAALPLRTRRPPMDFPDLHAGATPPNASAPAAPHAPAPSDTLPDIALEVQAVLDLPPVRLSALRHWTPGTVLPGAAAIDGTEVLLTVAGRRVGRGRLVAVETLLGFELTELLD
jgi:flagellar motor switch/type III secretory pathway protein FliN